MVAYFMEQFKDLLHEIMRSFEKPPAKARREARREELSKLGLFTDAETESILDEFERQERRRRPATTSRPAAAKKMR